MKRKMDETEIKNAGHQAKKIETLVCSNCGQSSFSSRNKLFAHLKACLIQRNPKNYELISDDQYFDQHIAYIYVTGGRFRGKTLNCIERYCCGTNTWESLPDMTEHRGSHGSVVISPYLYILGGGGLHSNLATCEKIDCTDNQKLSMQPMLSFRHALAVVSDNLRFLYAVGGWIDGSVCSKDLERYDVIENCWDTLSPMPTGRRLLGAAYLGEKIYCFGGNCQDHDWNTNVLEIYDVASDSWSTGCPLPHSGQTSAIAILDFIFVVVHGKCILRYDPLENTYTEISNQLPNKSWFCFDMTVINNKIYFHGGNIEGKWSNCLWKYCPFENKWVELAPMQKVRRRCAATPFVVPIK